MANPEQVELLKTDVHEWWRWRGTPGNPTPDLSRADLRFLDITGADLAGADLSGATLFGTHLKDADLSGANLTSANLSFANLTMANLEGAVLKDARLDTTNLSLAKLFSADLSSARISDTHFAGSTLFETRFTDAKLRSVVFADVDLSWAIGLETVNHHGPSTIGIDTIYRSQGKIPEVFLRGCGVPDEFIAYIGSMVGRPIEFYSCFISYSTKDQEFADRLYADLQAKGVRCWFAPHDIKGGRKIHEQIDEAIRLHDKLLLILSEQSMASDWVGTEIANAREREAREKKQMLFPITIAHFEHVNQWKLFDADRGKDSAREIREYFIPDFSNWKDHDSYQKAFQRLVGDLKAESK